MLHVSNSEKNSRDRFIPLRFNATLTPNTPNFDPLEIEVFKNCGFLNYAKIRYNQNNYKNELQKIMFPYEAKVLNFFPPKKCIRNKNPEGEPTWPVKPREKPVIDPPQTVLDMPQFDSYICHNICDWSSKGYIATIFENEVHIWNSISKERTITSTFHRIQHSIKWRSGTSLQFAVGLSPSSVGIWDLLARKLTCWRSCCCFPQNCEVFALEWITPKFLVTGCSQGTLKIFTSKLKKIRGLSNAHNGAIIKIASSCDRRFIATTGLDKRMIVWKIPDLERHFCFETDTISKAVAWHPWRGSVLAVGVGQNDGHIVILNINEKKPMAEEKFTYQNTTVDALTFNPISGELAGYFVRDVVDGNKGVGVVVVFSDIDQIVEELHLHDGPILYLLWGNEGQELASASADENLCIWDFFGKINSQNGRNKKEESPPKSSVLLRTIR
ncbi:protein cortex-like isoform X2 [Tribolium madens]|uniref:protein cortex-like isoform X2 n=1 Tax=Tribolium madens TaxID=41895 RepID=UPI001CF75AB9|nr:protein cortex-like isoform X2 [Tribolium madens]